jgi:hypothetical protein
MKWGRSPIDFVKRMGHLPRFVFHYEKFTNYIWECFVKILRWRVSFAVLYATAMLLAGCGGGGGGGGAGGGGGGPTPYVISGTTTFNGAPLGYVGINLSRDYNTTDIALESDSSGHYSFSALQNGYHVITPYKAGYTFTPVYSTRTVNGQNFTGVDFAATVATYFLSGRVTSGGVGLQNVAMTLSGASSASTVTDSTGNYSFSGLALGSYTIIPSLSGYTFSPLSSTYTINGLSNSGVNFSVGVVPAPGTLTIFNASSSQIDQAYTRLSSSSSWGLPWNGSSLSTGLSWSLSLTPGTYDNQVASLGTTSTYYAYDLAYTITSGSTHSFNVSDQDFTGTLLINNLNTTYPITEVYVSATTIGGGPNQLSTSIAPTLSRQIVDLPSGTYYVRVVQNGVNIDSTTPVASHSYTPININ